MICQGCGLFNAPGAPVCARCAALLGKTCSKCGFESPAAFKFCGACGNPLAAASGDATAVPAPEPPAPSVAPPPPGISASHASPASSPHAAPESREGETSERRQLTVMFCDLVDSTVLSSQLDPEDLHALVRSYQQTCVSAIEAQEGHVAQYLGDGLLVYFGYPAAHEDDARRAVTAGLAILGEVAALDERMRATVGAGIAVRIGVHTGPVVTGQVGAGKRRETLAMGKTPNVAARLQGLATPNTLVLSATTEQLVRGAFTLRSLGYHKLKGIAEEMTAFEAVAASRVQARVDVVSVAPIGREPAVARILSLFERAGTDGAQVVLLTGEAGIGKSHLTQWVRQEMSAGASAVETMRCYAHSQGSALRPLIDLLAARSGLDPADAPEGQIQALERFLRERELTAPEALPLLAELLSVPLPEERSVRSLQWSPQRVRDRTVDLAVQVLLQPAARGTVVLSVEDLHWADPSTLELLDVLIQRAAGSRALLLLNARPGFTAAWAARSNVTNLTLERLEPQHATAIVQRVTGGRPLPADLLAQVLSKTDGIPLFVEEVTKMVLESGALALRDGEYEYRQTLAGLTIPTTLQDSLMARLDGLGDAKAVARLGAVLGRQFSFEMLREVADHDERSLRDALERLVGAGLLGRRGDASGLVYEFRHALIQETAMSSLLKSAQRQHHRRVADVLVARFPKIVSEQPETVAHHYTQAGLPEHAVAYWLNAGRRDLSRSANREAILHLSRGLAAIEQLPPSAERDRRELDTLTSLAPALIAIRTYASPEVERAYERARALCEVLGDTRQTFLTLWGLFTLYLVRAELQKAIDLGRQMAALSERSDDAGVILGARVALGTAYYYNGELVTARENLQQALELDRPERDRSTAFLTGQDVGMVGRLYLSLVLCFMGSIDEAMKLCVEAVGITRAIAHPFSLAFALHFLALLHQYRRERGALVPIADEMIAVCEEHDFLWWLLCGKLQRLWALAGEGATAETLAELRESRRTLAALGAINGQTQFQVLEAETFLLHGHTEDARATLDEAIAFMNRADERHCEVDIHRLAAELSLADARVADASDPSGEAGAPARRRAAEQLDRALAVARRQGARAAELRAAMTLARMRRDQGDRPGQAAARALLVELHEALREGRGAPDLVAARALIAELG